jgi:predicted exporter
MFPQLSKIAALLLWAMGALAVAFCANSLWPQGEWLKTDFYSLLPENTDNPWLVRANALASSSYDSQMVVMVEGNDGADVSRFLEVVRDRLQKEGYVDTSFDNSEAGKWRALSELLFPYRWGLLNASDRETLRHDPAGYLAQFRRLLYSPLGGVLASTLQSDPGGLYRSYFEAAIPSMVEEPPVTSANEPVSELTVFNVLPQQLGFGAMAGLYITYGSLKEEAKQHGLSLYATGTPLYSAYGVHSAELEISTIGLASLVAVILLLLAALRSLTAILLTLICVSSGVVGGFLTTVVLLQEIHVLTLVFGVTIIGIAADYSFHYLSHSLVPGWSKEEALSKVLVGLCLGTLSSVVAFTSLTFLPFPGIRQIGIFMAVGLLCSFLTVYLLFPAVYRGALKGASLPRFFRRTQFKRRGGWAPLVLLGVVAIPGLYFLQARDEIRDFYAVPDALEKDQAAMLRALSLSADSRYLLVRAPSEEEVLVAEEALISAADELKQAGQLGELSGVTRLVPSAYTQQVNFDLVRDLIEGGYLSGHLDDLGFSYDSQQAILAELPTDFRPIGVDILDDVALPTGTGGFLGCEGSECASWVRVSGVRSTQVLENLVSLFPAVILVDPVANINALLARYRTGVVTAVIAGGILTTLVLTVVCGLRRALQIMSLPVTACVLSLAMIGYISGSYTIINLLSLLLIIGVSLDYAIFRAFTTSVDQPATSLAITLSALTSILAFGLLALSETPLISSFGLTIAIGLITTYCLSWIKFDWDS